MAPRSGRRLVERHFVDNGYDYAHLQIKICFRKTEMFSFIVENNLNHGKDDYQVGHHQRHMVKNEMFEGRKKFIAIYLSHDKKQVTPSDKPHHRKQRDVFDAQAQLKICVVAAVSLSVSVS